MGYRPGYPTTFIHFAYQIQTRLWLHSIWLCTKFLSTYAGPSAASEMTYTVSGGALNSTQTKPNAGPSTKDCVTVRSMVNIARLTIWSIYCSLGGGEGRADPLIVVPFIGAA